MLILSLFCIPGFRTSLTQGTCTVDDDMRRPLLHTIENLANAHRWLISLLYFCFYTTTTKTGHDVLKCVFPTLRLLAQINSSRSVLVTLLANPEDSSDSQPWLAPGSRDNVYKIWAASSTLLKNIARTVCQAHATLGNSAIWPRNTSNAWQPGEQAYVTSML